MTENRMSRLITCFFGAFLLIALPLSATAEEARVLNIIENDWPPYFFAGKPDNPEGIAKALLKQCLPATGYEYTFSFYPIKRMYLYLKQGKLDLAVFSYKKERESFLMYGKEPLFSSGYRPVVLADKKIRIESLKDFDALRLGHLAGLRYSEEFFKYVENRRKNGTLILATTGDSCIRMLLAGIIDVFVDTRSTTLWHAKQRGVLDKIRVLDFDIQTKNYFVTLSRYSDTVKDKAGFLDQMDRCIRAAKADGTYQAITREYGWE